MSYDSALVSTAADVAALTGRQGIGNLTGAGFVLADFLLESTRWVYKRLEDQGKDPSQLTNESRLRRAVALHAVALLVAGGHLETPEEGASGAETYLDFAEREVDSFRPTYASGQESRQAAEDLPAVANFEDGMEHMGRDAPRINYRRTWPRRM